MNKQKKSQRKGTRQTYRCRDKHIHTHGNPRKAQCWKL